MVTIISVEKVFDNSDKTQAFCQLTLETIGFFGPRNSFRVSKRIWEEMGNKMGWLE